MRKLLFFFLFITIYSQVHGQKTDSIKYDHGYLYYHEYGSGEPIVILTGGPGSSYLQLEEVAVRLGKNYRSILLEQRGTGRSIPTPLDSTTVNLKAAQNDINLLLDHLKLTKAIVVGHSWGAMLGMSYASTYPNKVKSLILLATGPYKPSLDLMAYMDNREISLGACELARRDSLSKKVKANTATKEETEELKKMSYLSIVYNKGGIDSLYQKITKGGNNSATSYLLFNDWMKTRLDLSNSLPLFRKPIYIITGRQDPGAYMSYELKILVPAAKLYWIDRAGHFPMFEQPETFYSTLLSLLELDKN